MSTPNLLKILSECSTICIDATYKLNWMRFPLIILGTVDRKKHFHPLDYACSSHETTQDYEFVFSSVKIAIEKHFPESQFNPKKLIADGADAIRNAFYNVFESAEIDIMCFAHVIRNVRKRPFASKMNKTLIIDDIKKYNWHQIEKSSILYQSSSSRNGSHLSRILQATSKLLGWARTVIGMRGPQTIHHPQIML